METRRKRRRDDKVWGYDARRNKDLKYSSTIEVETETSATKPGKHACKYGERGNAEVEDEVVRK
jgi:hypothetical protein